MGSRTPNWNRCWVNLPPAAKLLLPLVLCVDEKSQIQALDRTRPILPLRPGVPARQSHDYIRNGTTSLFAALDVATGKVIGSLHHRQRHQALPERSAPVPQSAPRVPRIRPPDWTRPECWLCRAPGSPGSASGPRDGRNWQNMAGRKCWHYWLASPAGQSYQPLEFNSI